MSHSGPAQGPYMLYRVQDWAKRVLVKHTANTKSSERITCPENKELFQAVRVPPEAPREGTKANLSKRLGQQVLMKARSIDIFFVS